MFLTQMCIVRYMINTCAKVIYCSPETSKGQNIVGIVNISWKYMDISERLKTESVDIFKERKLFGVILLEIEYYFLKFVSNLYTSISLTRQIFVDI